MQCFSSCQGHHVVIFSHCHVDRVNNFERHQCKLLTVSTHRNNFEDVSDSNCAFVHLIGFFLDQAKKKTFACRDLFWTLVLHEFVISFDSVLFAFSCHRFPLSLESLLRDCRFSFLDQWLHCLIRKLSSSNEQKNAGCQTPHCRTSHVWA